MARETKIKVSFSISMTKSYSAQEISDWMALGDVDGYDIKDALRLMICEEVLDAMRDGKGCFKIVG